MTFRQRMWRISLPATMAIFGTVGVATAQSGSEQITEVRNAARAHLGPLYFSPRLTVENLGVDDNVFIDPKTGDPQSDFVATLTPQVRAWLPVAGRVLVTASVSPRVEYYRRFVNARSVIPQGTLRTDLFLGRLTLFGTGSFRKGRQRPSFEIDTRTLYQEAGVSAGVTYRLGPRLFVDVSGYEATTRFASNEFFLGTRLRDQLDQRDRGLRLTARRRLSAKTSAEVTMDASRAAFAFSSDRDASSQRLISGFDFAATALISGSARVGVRRFVPRSPLLPAFTGVVADVDLSYTLLSATRLTAKWSRDLAYSYETVQPYYVLNSVGGAVRRQIIGRMDVIVGLDRAESRYRTLTSELARDIRRDINRTYSADLGLRLNRTSRIGFAIAQSDRHSNEQTGRDYTRRRIGLSFTYGT